MSLLDEVDYLEQCKEENNISRRCYYECPSDVCHDQCKLTYDGCKIMDAKTVSGMVCEEVANVICYNNKIMIATFEKDYEEAEAFYKEQVQKMMDCFRMVNRVNGKKEH